MLELIGKSFKNGRGEILTVIDVDTDIAILADDQRISVSRLLDNKHYRPIDRSAIKSNINMPVSINENYTSNDEQAPDIFGNSSNRYGSLLNQMKTSLDRNPSLGEYGGSDSTLTSFKVIEPTVELAKPENIFIDDSNKIEETKRRMIENQKHLKDSIDKQTQNMSKLLDDEAVQLNIPTYEEMDREVSLSQYDSNDRKVSNTTVEPNFIQKENPAYQMFKNVKRSVPFKMNLELSKLLPKKEFIQMWEESYEISMIEYLADEFLRDLLSNPESLKIQIIEKLNDQVFPKKAVVKKTSPKVKRITKPRIIPQVSIDETEKMTEGVEKKAKRK